MSDEMRENFRIIEDEDLETAASDPGVATSAPLAQMLRPARVTPTAARSRQWSATDDPFEYSLLIPVDEKVDSEVESVPTVDVIDVEDVEVPDEDARTTLKTPLLLQARLRTL